MRKTADKDRDPILDAVQAALTDFGLQVKIEIDALRAALTSEEAARDKAESQIATLAAALEKGQQHSVAQQEQMRQIVATTAGATEVVEATLMQRLDSNDSKLKTLEALTSTSAEAARVFDTRLAAIESWSDASTSAANDMEARLATISNDTSGLRTDLDTGLADLDTGLAERSVAIDEVVASAAGLTTGHAALETRIDQASSKLHEALDAAAVVDTAVQARLVEIGDELDRITAESGASITALNERSVGIGERVDELSERLTALEAAMSEIDVDAIDDLSERVSSAAGEAVLARIETERFQATIKEENDRIILRISEVETQVQAQEMDVESAVQLERLEEIERALIELDPAQFVRIDSPTIDGMKAIDPTEFPFAGSSGETGGVIAGRTDDVKPPSQA